jgi:AcrR family transcriptional regulator
VSAQRVPAAAGSAGSDGCAAASTRRRGAVLEQAICHAALAELAESGYPAFTVDAVAARARTGKASIYRRWADKAELLSAAICAAMPVPVGTELAVELPDSVSTRDAFVQLFEHMIVSLDRYTADALRCVMAAVAHDDALREVMHASVLRPREDGMRTLVARGIRLGDVRPDPPLDLLADLIPGFLMKRILLGMDPVLDAATSVRFVDEILMPVLAVRPDRHS